MSGILSEVVACPPCAEVREKTPPLMMAAVIVAAALLIYYLVSLGSGAVRRIRDGFASRRAQEVYSQSKDFFTKQGNENQESRFSEYKTVVPNADVVLYDDVKKMWNT